MGSRGRAKGRADLHWAEAKEVLGIRDSYENTLRRLEDTTREPAEPIIAFENQGEMPTLTDQGEGQLGPNRTAAKETAHIYPLSSSESEELEGPIAVRRGIETAIERDKRERGG